MPYCLPYGTLSDLSLLVCKMGAIVWAAWAVMRINVTICNTKQMIHIVSNCF